MIVSASVLLPEPFGPMIAWTSPLFTTRSIPLRIGLLSTSTWRSVISRSGMQRVLLHVLWGRGLHEVREGHAVERLRDRRLQRHPYVVRRAARLQHAIDHRLALGGAELRLDGSLERAHDVTGGDRGRIARKRVAAARAALAVHQSGLAQARDELLEIRLGQLLARRDRMQAHGALTEVTREVDHEAHAVLAAGGNVESGLGSNSEHFTRYSSAGHDRTARCHSPTAGPPWARPTRPSSKPCTARSRDSPPDARWRVSSCPAASARSRSGTNRRVAGR